MDWKTLEPICKILVLSGTIAFCWEAAKIINKYCKLK